MSDETQQHTPEDDALGAFNYAPPSQVASNTNQIDAAAIQAAIDRAVAAALAQRGVTPPAPEKSPEEHARAAIDNAGAGLGIDERFAELYRHLDLIAKKVGL